jgi:hypothetical protein
LGWGLEPTTPADRLGLAAAADLIQRQGARVVRPHGLVPRMEPRVLR